MNRNINFLVNSKFEKFAIGLIFIKKKENSVIFTNYGGFQSRNNSIISLFKLMFLKYKIPDFNYIIINTEDKPINIDKKKSKVFSFSSAKGYYDIAIPDFLFHSWPEVLINDYEEKSKELNNIGKVHYLEEKLGWIGNCNTNNIRWKLFEIGKQNSEICDIMHLDPSHKDFQSKFISLEELARRYKYLIDIEGNGYSARIKLLMHSGRTLFLQERKWENYFFNMIKPYVHYIPLKSDLSDLIEKLNWAKANNERVDFIANEALNFAKEFLTKDYAIEYYYKCFKNINVRTSIIHRSLNLFIDNLLLLFITIRRPNFLIKYLKQLKLRWL